MLDDEPRISQTKRRFAADRTRAYLAKLARLVGGKVRGTESPKSWYVGVANGKFPERRAAAAERIRAFVLSAFTETAK
jgi:hypothetical protein